MTARATVVRRGRALARRGVDRVGGRHLGTIRRVRTAEQVVALTFDDGPDPARTPQVLDALATAQARATFFMLLNRARRHPDLVAEVAARGHEVALHGVDHRSVAGRPRREVASGLTAAAAELSAMAGSSITLFRPPYGAQSVGSYLGVRDAGLACVVWDVDSLDWRGEDLHAVSGAVIAAARPGAVVLMHDGLAGVTARARPDFDRAGNAALVLAGLRRRDLESTTVSRLVALGAPDRTVWLRRPPAEQPPDE